ncbi:type II toxin-antitoxin system HicB family antitoxin [Anaerococcus sp. AGMB00486]|uniref:Type II toxin-antitoxin system HicB family antitoxin n=2 Tax=Anaerococcus TaxID=165779 RepID=A0ABX2N822_9FIRM|nr:MULTISPECIES: type II toxin-antitoxin system HicB family antitoxin [Anaerococcus]MSS77365.1 type II toxin-antitoxin system HicB family antitoxin [Anaerococcus porci]NVF10834.1 type II toxin-antitoxin system HicB family antitoxin [Anaerococcus faecalis]
MFISYPAVFLKDKESNGYTILFPDLPGCISCGDDIKDALYMANDVLGGYLFDDYSKLEDLPKSSRLEDIDIMNSIDENGKEYFSYEGSFKSYVGLDLTDYVKKYDNRTVKKNVTIPSYLNEMGKSANINFSKLLTEALEKEFEIE